jgi:hypothetical protein
VQCARCRTENREGRRFCGECGQSFGLTCAACGFLNEGGEKFCGGCGRSLTAPAASAAPRFQSPQAYMPKHLAAHCHLDLGTFFQAVGRPEHAREHLMTATMLYREMDMRAWQARADAEMRRLA